MKNFVDNERNLSIKRSFEVDYDKFQNCPIIKILDRAGMYPCLWHDPDVGIRKIIKTNSGKIQMI